MCTPTRRPCHVAAQEALRVLAVAFLLNWPWEALHAAAYVESSDSLLYRFRHCLPMAGTDALWTLALWLASAGLVSRAEGGRWRLGVVAAFGFVTAVLVEHVALTQERWTYNDLMPVVPIVDVGLWPVAQMTLLPVFATWLVTRRSGQKSSAVSTAADGVCRQEHGE